MSETTTQVFMLRPVSNGKGAPAEEVIRKLLERGWYVFSVRTPGVRRLKPGDRICFYQSRVGVVAEATVTTSVTEHRLDLPFLYHPGSFPLAVRVEEVRYFFDRPVRLDEPRRRRLDAFNGKDPNKAWAWFLQGARILTPHDFEVLTGRV